MPINDRLTLSFGSNSAISVGNASRSTRVPAAPISSWSFSPSPPWTCTRRSSSKCYRETNDVPSLIIVHSFGDITQGVATQCLKSTKCSRAKLQYFANVCLKINVKLGGINTVPDARSVPVLTDPHNPTVVMG